MRYDQAYAAFAERAVNEAVVDIEAFIQQMLDVGVSPDVLEQLMLEDLSTGGPIFGKFFRSVNGAVDTALTVAEQQSSTVGEMLDTDKQYQKIFGDKYAKGADAFDGDPAKLEELEKVSDNQIFTWIATLRNTCHRCVVLHGQKATGQEWKERGLHPSTIHSGWRSNCYCKFVLEENSDSAKDLKAPLLRIRDKKTATGLSASRGTIRGVTQRDLDKAIAARNKALAKGVNLDKIPKREREKILEGRRTLRLLGKSQSTDG